jgi:hypothetical protein
MADHRWWSRTGQDCVHDPFYPEDLIEILTGAVTW